MSKWDPETDRQYEVCFVTGKKFRYGPHIYEGRRVAAWDEMISNEAEKWNADGIVPSTYPHVIKALEEKGIEVKLNEKGWLPIPR